MIFAVFLVILTVLEITTFIGMADEIGGWATLGLWMVATGIGIYLIRTQGMKTAASLQQALDKGDLPGDTVFNDLCRFLAGVLFIIPGFLTDVVAIALLAAPTRALLRMWASRYFNGQPIVFSTFRASRTRRNDDIVDVEYTHVETSSRQIPPGGNDKP